MECASLLSMSQNVIRQGVRARFLLGIEKFETEFVQRQAEHNRHGAVFDDTPPLYNYSQIFADAIAPYIHYNLVQRGTLDDMLRGHMDVLEFVSLQHEQNRWEGLDSYGMGMPPRVGTEGLQRREGPVRYERFIQFILWLQIVQPEVVPQIMQNVSGYFQLYMFKDNASMEQFRLALKWDQQYEGALFLNENDSHVHFMMRNPDVYIHPSVLFMDKLKEIVAVYGYKYLMHVPKFDHFSTDTLVTSLLRTIVTTDFGAPEHAVLDYLIRTCPEALKIKSRCPHGESAFGVVCQRWKDAGIARHVSVVDHVMQHADITDIYGAVSTGKTTLLGYAKKCENVLVLNYIRQKFGIE